MKRDLNNLNIAVVGATGVVGREMVNTLESRGIELGSLLLFASERSVGKRLEFCDSGLTVRELTSESFVANHIDIALFSAGSSISREFAPIAADNGAVVIDNSSAFRMDDNIPLVVPEVNAHVVKELISSLPEEHGHIIANPNCSTVQLVVVLKPIAEKVGIKRVVVSTYQSTSGAGQKGIDELGINTLAIFNQTDSQIAAFPHNIAFNCIPHIGSFEDNGYTQEEMKLICESRKILELPELLITVTAVRVPVFSCHAESVNIETEKSFSAEQARDLLRECPGVVVVDDIASNVYPLGCDLVGTDAVFVGRIRRDESVKHGLDMWIVADNLRKGAALNAVQIAELVIDSWRNTGLK